MGHQCLFGMCTVPDARFDQSLRKDHTDKRSSLQAEIPRVLPPGVEQIRILRTKGHSWYFKINNCKGWKSADIRTPRGRLIIHDMLKPMVRMEKGRIVEVQDRGALRTRRALMLNVGKEAADKRDVQDIDRKLEVMNIKNG